MLFKVTLKSKDEHAEEETSQLFGTFADWGDTEEEGEAEGEMIYFLHRSTYENIHSWCEAAKYIGIILDFRIEEQ